MPLNKAEEQPYSCEWRNEMKQTRHEMYLVVRRMDAFNEVNKS